MTDDDEPDPIVDGKIDLGALAAEFFALGLDPYPRKPGVAFEPPAEPEPEATPFAVLRDGAEEAGLATERARALLVPHLGSAALLG